MKRLLNKKDIVQSINAGINVGIRILDNIVKPLKSQEIELPDEYPKEKHRVRRRKAHKAKKHHGKKVHHAKKHHAKKHHANWRKKSKR